MLQMVIGGWLGFCLLGNFTVGVVLLRSSTLSFRVMNFISVIHGDVNTVYSIISDLICIDAIINDDMVEHDYWTVVNPHEFSM